MYTCTPTAWAIWEVEAGSKKVEPELVSPRCWLACLLLIVASFIKRNNDSNKILSEMKIEIWNLKLGKI